MLVPVAEIANMPRTANIGRPWLRCFHHGFIDADWEKDRLVVAVLRQVINEFVGEAAPLKECEWKMPGCGERSIVDSTWF